MLISTSSRFLSAMEILKGFDTYAVDVESQGLHMYAKTNPARLCGIAIGPGFATDTSKDFYFSFRHEEGENLPLELLQPLRELLAGKAILNWNTGFDLKILHCDGFTLPPRAYDGMLASHLANELEPSYALKKISPVILGEGNVADSIELDAELKRRKLGKGDICKLPASLVYKYALADIDLARRMHADRMVELERWKLSDLYRDVCRYMLALVKMEMRGILLDQPEVHRQMGLIGPKMETIAQELRDTIGDINLNSPAQLTKALGLPKTERAFLEEVLFRDQRRDVKLLLDYRELKKAETGFFVPYLESVGADSRLRTHFLLHGSRTGRLSSRDVNLQQLSKDKSSRPFSIRSCFVAPPGSFLAECDLSQIEPRLAAHFSNDPTMLDAFRSGVDFYSAAARSMYRQDTINKEQRDSAKTLNLMILYGGGGLKASMRLGLRHEKLLDGSFAPHFEDAWRFNRETDTLEQVSCSVVHPEFCALQGKAYINKYYSGLPELQPSIKRVRQLAERNRYIRNPISGRVRRFIGKGNEPHKAYNSLLQGCASEILRIAIVQLDDMFTRGDDPLLLSQVHDAITAEIQHGPRAAEYVKIIKETMENAVKLAVPVIADAKIGPNLANMGTVHV